MKMRTALTLGLVTIIFGATSLLADDKPSSQMIVPPPTLRSGAYFEVDAGLNVSDNIASQHGAMSLRSGVRCDVSLGYAIKIVNHLTIAPAAELGILYNELGAATSAKGGSAQVSGSFYQVPVMGNLIVNWEFFPHGVLYGGGGAGVAYNKLNVTGVKGISTDVTNGEGDFAWQAMVGLRYTIRACELGIGYKYLAVEPSGLSNIGNNAIMASFAVHF